MRSQLQGRGWIWGGGGGGGGDAFRSVETMHVVYGRVTLCRPQVIPSNLGATQRECARSCLDGCCPPPHPLQTPLTGRA